MRQRPIRNGDDCISSCQQRVSADGFEEYLNCVNASSCTDIQTCSLPEASCDDVCSALGSCDETPRYPAALNGEQTCSELCGNAQVAEAMVVCGRAYAQGTAVCSANTFDDCFPRQLSAACLGYCDQRVDCGVDDDVDACYAACADIQINGDRVQNRRLNLRQTCWENEAADCDAAAQCDEPPASPIADNSALCALNETCNLIAPECSETIQNLGNVIGQNEVDCLPMHSPTIVEHPSRTVSKQRLTSLAIAMNTAPSLHSAVS